MAGNKERAVLGIKEPGTWAAGGVKKDSGPDLDNMGGIADLSPQTIQAAASYASDEMQENAYGSSPATYAPDSAAYLPLMNQADEHINAGENSFADQTTDDGNTKRVRIDGTSGENSLLGMAKFANMKNVVDKTAITDPTKDYILDDTTTDVALEGFPGAAVLTSVPNKSTRRVPRPGGEIGDAYNAILGADDPTGVIRAAVDLLKSKNQYHPTNDSPFFKKGAPGIALNEGAFTEEEETQGLFHIQRELGRYILSGSEGPIVPDGVTLDNPASGQRVKTSDMQAIARSLLLRATGDFKGARGILDSNDLNSAAGDTLQNPLVQIGLGGVDMSRLSLAGLTDVDFTNTTDRRVLLSSATGNATFASLNLGTLGAGAQDVSTQLATRGAPGPYNGVSFGQLNNFLEPFGNGVLLDSIGMLFIAVLAVAAILVVGFIVQAFVNIGEPNPKMDAYDPRSPWSLMFGAKRGMPDSAPDAKPPGTLGAGTGAVEVFRKFFLDDFMRIPNTDYGLFDAVGQGVPMMVGFPGGTRTDAVGQTLATGQGLVEFALNLVSTPAYYANYLRRIVMSGQGLANKISGVVASFSGGSASQGTEKIFPTLKAIFDSPVFRFFAISAGVGDAALKYFFGSSPASNTKSNMLFQNKGLKAVYDPDAGITRNVLDSNGKLLETTRDLNIKRARETARLRGNFTRFNNPDYKNTLSLSSFVATQVPDNRLRHPSTNVPLASLRTLSVNEHDVHLTEKALNAEYLPFYFHDLRTSEILSLPAFVTSFDDSFAVTYNPVQSYGRQDPVQIYGNTTRTINLSFMVVAFNESDHFAMWYTINKFVTMLYPQYSEGIKRELEVEAKDGSKVTTTFVQPFSQVPAASPVIRIRLGDIYKSNYTDTALQKLFGYDPANSAESISKSGLAEAGKSEAIRSTVYKELLDAATKKVNGNGAQLVDLIREGRLRSKPGTDDHPRISISEEDYQAFRNADQPNKKTNAKFFSLAGRKNKRYVKVKRGNYAVFDTVNKGFSIIPIGEEGLTSKHKGPKGLGAHENGDITKIIDVDYFKVPNFPEPKMYEGSQAIKKDIETETDRRIEAANAGANKPAPDASVFFNPKNNAIVRSFHSTRGQGLAGVITNMSLDYSQGPWQIDAGARGPMAVTITMGFAPIHDLPLGLDADGRMRSPAIPVVNPFVDRQGADSGATAAAGAGRDVANVSYSEALAAETRTQQMDARLGGKTPEEITSADNPADAAARV